VDPRTLATASTNGPRVSAVARLTAPARFEVVEQHVAYPSPGAVRLRVLACGVCASERHAVEDPQDSGAYPMLLGHEPVGIVEAVGAGVERVAPGAGVARGGWPSFADY
jgi:Zn-dependent alcohol dehydrogenase